MEKQFINLKEEKYSYVSQRKRETGRRKYTALRKTYNILSSGGNFPKYNYIFCINTIKVVSLMQHIKRKASVEDWQFS